MRLLIDIMSPTDFSGIVYSKPADLDVRYVVTNSVGYYILKKDGLETISKYYPAPFFNIEEVIKVSKDFFDGSPPYFYMAANVLRLCVCLPLAQCFNLITNVDGANSTKPLL